MGSGTVIADSKSRRCNSCWSTGARTAPQIGNPETKVSPNTTSSAPCAAASATKDSSLSSVLSLSRNTGAAWTAATRTDGQAVIRHLGTVLAECVGKMRRSLTVMIWLFMDDRDAVHGRSTESVSTVFDNSREADRCGRNSWRLGSTPRMHTSTLRFCGVDARRLRRRHVRQTSVAPAAMTSRDDYRIVDCWLESNPSQASVGTCAARAISWRATRSSCWRSGLIEGGCWMTLCPNCARCSPKAAPARKYGTSRAPLESDPRYSKRWAGPHRSVEFSR